MKRILALGGAIVLVVLVAVVGVTAWTVGRGAASAGTGGTVQLAANHNTTPHYTLTIATPDMLGGSEDTGPAYVPSTITLPADSDATLTIVNFDGPTALPSGSEVFATAKGIKGALSIQALDTVHPNAPGPVRTATSLDPAQGVSHTFTIAKLGINVPLAPVSTTTFTFHTPASGTFSWRCMDPCGNGPSGWGAAMSNDGFMQGKVTFA